MSSEPRLNQSERAMKLLASLLKMVTDGARTPEWLADGFQAMVNQPIYLRRLYETETITVGATDGTETIAGLSASGHATEAASVIVDEQAADGKLVDLFGRKGPFRRRWTRSQVAKFVTDNPNRLRGGGHANFFELENGFVANVFMYKVRRPLTNIYEFDYDRVWRALYRHRIFSLQ